MRNARTARNREPLLDLGAWIILLTAIPLGAIVALYLAGYAVPSPLAAAILALCLILAVVVGVRFGRRSKGG